MNDRVATLAVPAESRASDRLFAQLLRALASSGTEGGVAAERRVGSTSLRLVVRPPSLLESLEANLRVSWSSLLGDDARSADPPPGWKVGYGILTVPASVGVRPEQSRRDPRAPHPLANPMAQSGRWIDTRTYWVPRSGGGLWVARAYRVALPPGVANQDRMAEAGTLLAQHWSVVLGRPCVPRELSHRSAHRAWQAHSSDAASKEAWTAVDVERGAVAVDLPRPSLSVATLSAEPGHLSVFGTSGAGKTSFLAELAAEAIRRGEAVVALDLHGDLAPEIVDRLTPLQRERVIAIDVADRPIPGINVLRASSPEDGDRSVAHLVAALKRLSPDGQEIYWGFRLERIFDSFVRLVQEEGGSLVDLAGALESTERREALRAQTRQRELARFLDELGPILRRQPDFLWPAAARVSKVVLVPALAELLAPANGVEPAWEAGVRSGRSLVLRLPFAEIGSEAAALASTLLLARIYLAHAASATEGTEARPVLLLFDEAHASLPGCSRRSSARAGSSGSARSSRRNTLSGSPPK